MIILAFQGVQLAPTFFQGIRQDHLKNGKKFRWLGTTLFCTFYIKKKLDIPLPAIFTTFLVKQYIEKRTLKKGGGIPVPKSVLNRIIRSTLSNALLKSRKATYNFPFPLQYLLINVFRTNIRSDDEYPLRKPACSSLSICLSSSHNSSLFLRFCPKFFQDSFLSWLVGNYRTNFDHLS